MVKLKYQYWLVKTARGYLNLHTSIPWCDNKDEASRFYDYNGAKSWTKNIKREYPDLEPVIVHIFMKSKSAVSKRITMLENRITKLEANIEILSCS